MIKKKSKKWIVGLEIGTTKIVTLVGEILVDGTINIVGIGQCLSKGIDTGHINNLQNIVACIKKTIYEAEIISKYKISSIYLSISNKYIKCENEIGIIPIKTKEVTKQDIKNAIYTAQCIKLNSDYKILHTIPKEYSIDKDIGIRNPIGLSGVRMESQVHLITYKKNIQQNISKALKLCKLKIKKKIFSGLASSEAVLTAEEKKSGVCMIDIGGGSIDLVIYINGYIQHSQVIPYAGNIITHDIAYIFNISFKKAEKIKIQYGFKKLSSLTAEELIEISSIYGIKTKTIQTNLLMQIIESRYLELLNIINNIITDTQEKLYCLGKPYFIKSGLVFTGGSVQTKSLYYFSKKVFNVPIRIGKPININTYNKHIIHPSYATVIGLLKYGKQFNKKKKNINKKNKLQKWLNIFKNFFIKNKKY